MIRRSYIRQTGGQGESCFALITQDDHARLSGELARHLGTMRYARPEFRGWKGGGFESFVRAVSLHDAGWPLHDSAPTLNAQGYPSDVFETTREVAFRVWPGAPEAAKAYGPVAELLTSLHILALSAYATSLTSFQHEKLDVASLPARFELNKFQHREIERQERLRRELGLSTEIPLTMGLADEHVDEREDELRAALRWLQAMDLLSLSVCCTKPPQEKSQDVYARPGEEGEGLRVRREGDDLVVSPWPFGVERIEVEIPAVIVPARRYGSEGELHSEMGRGVRIEIRAVVRAY
jgi:hypothetical protein